MQVFLQIVAFSLQIIGSGRPVLTKGKRPESESLPSLCADSSSESNNKEVSMRLFLLAFVFQYTIFFLSSPWKYKF